MRSLYLPGCCHTGHVCFFLRCKDIAAPLNFGSIKKLFSSSSFSFFASAKALHLPERIANLAWDCRSSDPNLLYDNF